MRLFNLDLHISVIADIKEILEEQGHEVTSWSLSGHTWVFGRKPHPVEIVSGSTWRNIDQPMCEAFYRRYAGELNVYDAYLVTYPPAFAMLFERWTKPIIVVAATRYEAPFTTRPDCWRRFDEFLRTGIDQGRIIPLANNRYDARYAEHYTRRAWEVVPSICAYTNAPYEGTRPEVLLASRYSALPGIPGLVDKNAALRTGYSWRELAAYRAAVHIPYNASLMSIFEQYTAGIPLFFPSHAFLMELYGREGVMSQVSWLQVLNQPPIPGGPNHYTDHETMADWFQLADWYHLPHVVLFDSFRDLENQLSSIDFRQVSHRMQAANADHRAAVRQQWARIMERVTR